MVLKKKRYKECNWVHKQLRNLWFIAYPFIAIFYYLSRKRIYHDKIVNGNLVRGTNDEYDIMTWNLCWKIARGDIDFKMGKYHTHEEVEKMLKEKYG